MHLEILPSWSRSHDGSSLRSKELNDREYDSRVDDDRFYFLGVVLVWIKGLCTTPLDTINIL